MRGNPFFLSCKTIDTLGKRRALSDDSSPSRILTSSRNLPERVNDAVNSWTFPLASSALGEYYMREHPVLLHNVSAMRTMSPPESSGFDNMQSSNELPGLGSTEISCDSRLNSPYCFTVRDNANHHIAAGVRRIKVSNLIIPVYFIAR